ncbi:Pre-mRNA-splicing helicase BRR2 [Candida viswanathii]|uniref:Pre-mRNA-splicing helicase BRR2 n=1 Tax=Candida viswanathii TaxID=5486 RepID=A0A367YJS8_9ASCO|nr:Pre-mRNA-splicing helicase BRR2 [Candida viswanathii]
MSKTIPQKRKADYEETAALSVAGRISVKDMGTRYKAESAPSQQPKKPAEEDNDQVFELFMAKIRDYIPDSSHEVIQSAAEVASEQLASRDVPVQEKRKEIEELLSVKVSDADLNELIGLANAILARQSEQEKLQQESETGVAVEFDDEEDEEDGEDEIVEEEESVECDWEWLQSQTEHSLEIFKLLANKELGMGQLENEISELLDYEHDTVIKCLENRWKIVSTRADAPAEESMTGRVPQRISLDKIIFSTNAETTKITLPEGTFQENKKSYDIITVPAPEPPVLADDEILPTSVLPQWAQDAFPSNETTTFNRIQSRIYPQAFETDKNLLICAPTGAGKTNVAMLTILRTIGEYKKDFKVVYIAPLKALVQEQMREFQRRLTLYGIVVNELTGDLSLSKQQIAETHVIVTTPEKWDIITRKDPSYVKLVKLIIIDEIHLLHDERGPVLENIVSRTLRRDDVRIVGLSATLPNYGDVAKFIRVKPEGLFYFDASYRPCPLQQQFVGVKEKKAIKKVAAMNEACHDRVTKSLQEGHQIIVFVHSRNETFTTAKYLAEKLDVDIVEHEGTKEVLKQEAEAMGIKLRDIITQGFGVHHAGLTKQERATVEDLFAQGHLRVLVSTATLAWGVNLPAHTVIIKGTETYSPETGTWVQLSPQDILQMLGRAGRPRYDKNGEGIIITSQDEIQYYLAILNQQLPIESQLVHKLVDSVNAEVVAGTIGSIEDGIEWLGYTYLYVRMLQSPSLYGVDASNDPTLYHQRADLVFTALSILHENRLVVYDPATGSVQSTELGRIASYFYINYETINQFGKMLKPWHTESEILRVFASAGEFKYIPVRQEERLEISKLMEKCPIPIREQPHEPLAKVNILLQTYISRLKLEGFALVADMIYITQSAGRLLRALYEIALLQKWSSLAKTILGLCKMVQNRMWLSNSPLRQFGSLVPPPVIRTTEMSHLPWPRYFQLTAEELGEALGGNGQLVKDYVDAFPRVVVDYVVQPINDKYLRVQVEVTPEWRWIPAVHGGQEMFAVMVEDCNGSRLLHHEQFAVKKKSVGKPQMLEFFVPTSAEPNYMLSIISEKWVNCTWKTPIWLADLQPCKVGSYFVETNLEAVLDAVSEGESVFVGCSKTGRTAVAELAMTKNQNVLFISPDESRDGAATPEQLIRWKNRKFRSFDLVIADDVHLVGRDANYEMVLSRIRMVSSAPIIALSSPLASPRDMAEWLGISKSNVFNFALDQEITVGGKGKILPDTLVFVNSRKAALEMAQSHVGKWTTHLEKYISKIQDPVLAGLVEHGIGLYYAGMLRVDRLIVERLFGAKELQLVFATRETCRHHAPGAENVVIYDTSLLTDVYEMVGLGKKVQIVTPDVDFYSAVLHSGLPVESLLPNTIADFFMHGIVSGIVKEKQGFIDMLTYTYFYRRLMKNPSFYELKEVSSDAVSEYLSEMVESVVEELEKEEFIEDLTPLNKAVIASHYSTFETVAKVGKLTNKSKLKDVFHAICSASEFEFLLPVRDGEESVLSKLADKLPIKYTQESNHKAFVLLQAHISRLTLPHELKHDQDELVRRATGVVNACVDTIASGGFLNAMLAMDVSQMIAQRVWSSDNPLKQIPHFGTEILARCKEHSVETVYDIMSLEDDERDEVLRLDGEELNDVAEFVNDYPNVELKVEVAGGKLTVLVERDEEGFTEGWWVVVGEKETGRLLEIKKVKIDKETQRFEFDVVPGGKVSVYLICESFLDADKEVSV